MERVESGPYIFRLGLFADPDLSPANLGEAFDYYSAIPGWGWRAIVYSVGARWQPESLTLGASLGVQDFALAEPEEGTEPYFPGGRAVNLKGGGTAFEGGIPLPPANPPDLGSTVAVWLTVRDGNEIFGAELRFSLRENESWDALLPSDAVVRPRNLAAAAARVWSPAEEAVHWTAAEVPAYTEPARPGLPAQLSVPLQRVVALAGREAQRLSRGATDPEALLLGLLAEGSEPAAQVLQQAGVGLPEVRAAVEFTGMGQPPGHHAGARLSPSADKALLLAGDEAYRMGSLEVSTE
ncbi:MAG: Clp protease N-terminal domain-containing protein, partial [Chloroflexota bacterium]